MRVALIGTRGVPATYGGFETAVEEVGRRLVDRGHSVTVFCRGDRLAETTYLGMQLVHLPAVQRRVLETLTHTGLSVLHPSLRETDVAILFNAANAPLLPVLRARRIPTAVHVDGLEWRRSKWGPMGRRYYLLCERLAVRWAQRLIADARAIQRYYEERYRITPEFLAYGAPIILKGPVSLDDLQVLPQRYHLLVARFEPENHVLQAVQAYAASSAKMPFLVVGSAPYSAEYTRRISAIAATDERIRLIGPVWDQALLDSLYAGALSYVHGHSVGGTNPSLLRAMGAGAPVLAYDVVFNREVLGSAGRFWATPSDLLALLERSECSAGDSVALGAEGQRRARDQYDWDEVASGYEQLCVDLLRARRG